MIVQIAHVGCLLAFAGTLTAPDQASHDQAEKPEQRMIISHRDSSSDGGDRIFATNCSPCQTAPMSIGSRKTGMVIVPNRVRAQLSSEDEQILLKYMAP